MEAIRNYLDRMFANLPGTPSVLRAKEELWQMMEDKYTELISEGKSENEAVGSVISEFGNLSELAEALGLEEELKETQEEMATEIPERILTVEDAKGFIGMKSEMAVPVSFGIAMCIFSIIPPILVSEVFDGLPDAIAPLGMLIFVLAGVGLIIYGNLKKRRWGFLRTEKCTLSMEATKYVNDERDRFDGTYVAEMIIGIIFCACAWVPAALVDEIFRANDEIGGVLFFLFIGIGVFLLIHSHIRMGGYKKLLKLNKKGTMKAAYKAEREPFNGEDGNPVESTVAQKETKYISPLAEFFMDVYWPTCVCLYLCASFITFAWGLTWVIWPVAGILHGVFRKNLTE